MILGAVLKFICLSRKVCECFNHCCLSASLSFYCNKSHSGILLMNVVGIFEIN